MKVDLSAAALGGESRRSGYRELHSGMGQAVAERTYLRPLLTAEAQSLLDPGDIRLNPKDPHFRKWVTAVHNTDGYTPVLDVDAPLRGEAPPTRWETWGELADRVAAGNAALIGYRPDALAERELLRHHIAKATCIMSGRHLQHGDINQPTRPMEVFTNCSTSPTSFALFYLLLNGSGVGRCYDDDMMLVNWDNMPTVRVVLDQSHPDFDYSQHMSVRDANHLYGKGNGVHWYKVPDSREGWAQAIETLEIMTYQRSYRDDVLILDFSPVRAKGEPIMGMQGRPSSGPVPLMNAFEKIGKVKGAGLKPWLQTLYIDHYLAEPVLVGGARRAARMSTKHWSDTDIMDFIEVKRPIEYQGMSMGEVLDYRANCGKFAPTSFLWSSNNSVTVDEDFWRRVRLQPGDADYQSPLSVRARAVLNRVAECGYGDGTGEPGLINVNKLTKKNEGMDTEVFKYGGFMHSDRYQVQDETRLYLIKLYKTVRKKTNGYIVNPCGEIVLNVLGAFCVIADIVPFHADSVEEGEQAARVATRSLIRVNTMDSLYRAEVRRTNRIGVGQTGIHEFAWKFFQIGFRDIIAPDFEGFAALDLALDMHATTREAVETFRVHADPKIRAAAFWEAQGMLSRAVMGEAIAYSGELGMNVPHTSLTEKPAGTTSKLFGLTEAWHLPAMAHYLRWVQFREDNPMVAEYEAAGYPVRRSLKTYAGTAIVGFPTEPAIASLGMGDALVLAGDASPEEQYEWLKLGEFFWLEGGSVNDYTLGLEPRGAAERYGAQISYTLKYDPAVTSYEEFAAMMLEHQPTIRCCSVMPQTSSDSSAYEYLPEQPLNKIEFEAAMRVISEALQEDIGREHVGCDNGACPVDFNSGNK
jgi:ribonucleoside-triphosphate reductase (formate)